MNQSLTDHVKKAISQGYSIQQIKETLLKQGYDASTIEESIRNASKLSNPRKKVLVISVIILVLIILGFGLSYYYPKIVINKSTGITQTKTEINKVQGYVDTGWDLYKQKKFEEAIAQFDEALALNPDASLGSSAYTGLGSSYYQLKDYEKAKEGFNKALEINSVNDVTHTGLGWVYYQQIQYDKSKTEFEKAININPNNDMAHSGLGWIYLIMADLDNSLISFNKALAIEKSFGSYNGLGWTYYYLNKFDEAIDNFDKAAEMNPDIGEPYTGLALSEYKLNGATKEAMGYINQALGAKQITWGDYYHIAYFYHLTGQNDKGLEYIEKSLSINPTYKPSLELKQKISS